MIKHIKNKILKISNFVIIFTIINLGCANNNDENQSTKTESKNPSNIKQDSLSNKKEILTSLNGTLPHDFFDKKGNLKKNINENTANKVVNDSIDKKLKEVETTFNSFKKEINKSGELKDCTASDGSLNLAKIKEDPKKAKKVIETVAKKKVEFRKKHDQKKKTLVNKYKQLDASSKKEIQEEISKTPPLTRKNFLSILDEEEHLGKEPKGTFDKKTQNNKSSNKDEIDLNNYEENLNKIEKIINKKRNPKKPIKKKNKKLTANKIINQNKKYIQFNKNIINNLKKLKELLLKPGYIDILTKPCNEIERNNVIDFFAKTMSLSIYAIRFQKETADAEKILDFILTNDSFSNNNDLQKDIALKKVLIKTDRGNFSDMIINKKGCFIKEYSLNKNKLDKDKLEGNLTFLERRGNYMRISFLNIYNIISKIENEKDSFKNCMDDFIRNMKNNANGKCPIQFFKMIVKNFIKDYNCLIEKNCKNKKTNINSLKKSLELIKEELKNIRKLLSIHCPDCSKENL